MKDFEWIFLLTFLLCTVFANTQIEIGKMYNGFNEEGSMSYYELKIPSNYDQKSDLVIKASATEDKPYENPDIYLSTTEMEPW